MWKSNNDVTVVSLGGLLAETRETFTRDAADTSRVDWREGWVRESTCSQFLVMIIVIIIIIVSDLLSSGLSPGIGVGGELY